jgi:hypothetical protein
MIDQLTKFLAEQKQSLLSKEIGVTKTRIKDAIEAQIRVIETILIFVAQHKTKPSEDRDMEALKLSLDTQAKPLSEVRSKRGRKGSGQELVKALLEFVEDMPKGFAKELNGGTLKPKTIAAKVRVLQKSGVLPKNVIITRSAGKIFLGKE